MKYTVLRLFLRAIPGVGKDSRTFQVRHDSTRKSGVGESGTVFSTILTITAIIDLTTYNATGGDKGTAAGSKGAVVGVRAFGGFNCNGPAGRHPDTSL